MMRNKSFFGIEIITTNEGEKYVRFDSMDNHYRLIFRRKSWYVEVSAISNFSSQSAEIELLEEETLSQFVNRFFETYTFDGFFDTFNDVSDDEDGGGLISYASFLD